MGLFGFRLIVIALACTSVYGQDLDIQGIWRATMADSVSTQTGTIRLDRKDGKSVSGTFTLQGSEPGLAGGQLQGNTLHFNFTLPDRACPSSYAGILKFEQGKASGNYTGNSCRGWHADGMISLIRDDSQTERMKFESPRAPSDSAAPSNCKDVPLFAAKCIQPAVGSSNGATQVVENKPANPKSGYVDCFSLGTVVRDSADGADPVELKCGEPIEVTGETNTRLIVQTASGKRALLEKTMVSPTPPQVVEKSGSAGPVFSQQSNPNPTGLAPSTFFAVAYRVLPQQTTSYATFGDYSSSSSCYGQGQVLTDSLAKLSVNCDTTYLSPTQIPITWTVADVYNVVETGTHRMVIHCRASWRWSKCAPLIPGNVFEFELKGSEILVTAFKDGNPDKRMRIKYRIIQSELK
ncbi:MAG TPA: hypothetical protein VNK82_07900 [Terriglobales bacterium]|nr:hypothetical protein [Terriglobales bacterium]